MSKGFSLTAPVLLQESHATELFDCADEALNSYLKKHALLNNQNGSSRTYVTTKDNHVLGYYTITPGSVSKQETPRRIGKGLANYPVPVILLARLAIDKTERHTGLGKALLRDALTRIIAAADSIGGRAVLVHAKNKQAKSFYEHFGFEPSPIDPLHLYLLIKDIRKTLAI